MSLNPAQDEVYSIQHMWSSLSVTCDRGRWISPGTVVSSTNKTDRHDIIEILLKVALNTITLKPHLWWWCKNFKYSSPSLIRSLTKFQSSYQTIFHMHRENKILLNCPTSREATLLKRPHFHCKGESFIGLCFAYGVKHHFQQYFSYIVMVSLIDGTGV